MVSGDSGRPGVEKRTGAIEFTNALSHTYHVDAWAISEKGALDIAQLFEYDAVIWMTGGYWDDSINEKDAALLSKYIDAGGNLILSGAFIGFDWDHTDFLTQVAHADYLDLAEQRDLRVTLPNHRIAEGFVKGSTIPFIETSSANNRIKGSDVIKNTPNAQVIFQRDSKSKYPGAASIVAYEDDRAKIAYFAFPIYWLPAEQRNLLINNTVDWFSRKALPGLSK